MAALAIYERNPSLMNSVIASSVDKLPNYIREFEPDGQNAEGLSYWNYGLSNMITGLEAMSRVLGTDFGLFATNGMRKTGYFPLNTAGPIASLNLGDDAIKTSVSGTMMWFAKKYRDTALAKYQYDYAMANKAFSPGPEPARHGQS